MEINTFAMGSFGANCYLVKTKDVAIVIDPFDTDPRIENFFNSNKELSKYVLLTHCHFDHILGANKLRKLFGAKIVIGEFDAKGLYDTSLSLSDWIGLEQEPFEADTVVKDEDVLIFGTTKIRVVHTPGHTFGSVCYNIEDALFTGDTLFASCIGRTDVPTGDHSDILQSIIKLKTLFSEDIKIYPGHGRATTMKKEIENNPYM